MSIVITIVMMGIVSDSWAFIMPSVMATISMVDQRYGYSS